MILRSDQEVIKKGCMIVRVFGQHLSVVFEGLCHNWFWVLVFGSVLFEA